MAKQEEAKGKDANRSRKQKAESSKRSLELMRMVKCCELALNDHGAGQLPDNPDLEGPDAEGKPKIFEYGKKCPSYIYI